MGTQRPARQSKLAAQSATALQSARQAAVVGSQAYGPQEIAEGFEQAPLPSHVPCFCIIPPAHAAVPQATVGPLANPPHVVRETPSQYLCAQSVADSASHAGRLPRGLPMTGAHAPSAPATLHASHCPVQAELQQTPSTQNPEAHSLALLHDAPASPEASLPASAACAGIEKRRAAVTIGIQRMPCAYTAFTR